MGLQIPRCEKDCAKLSRMLSELKLASAPDAAVEEVAQILAKVGFLLGYYVLDWFSVVASLRLYKQ